MYRGSAMYPELYTRRRLAPIFLARLIALAPFVAISTLAQQPATKLYQIGYLVAGSAGGRGQCPPQ